MSEIGARKPGRSAIAAWILGLLVGCASAETPIDLAPSSDEFHLAFRRAEWSRAVDAAKTLVDAAPAQDTFAPYYSACALARAGKADSALQALATCAERGWFQTAAMETDPDLEAIRSSPTFTAILEKVRRTERTRLGAHASVFERVRLEKHYPKNFTGSKPLPLILALHGYGSSGADIASTWRSAADDVGAILVAPTATHSTPIGGQGWGSTEEGEAIVLGVIDGLEKIGAIDPTKIVLTGFSQGGALAIAVALRHPNLFAGVIPICGVFDPAESTIPLKAMPAFPRFSILNGAVDREAENNRTATRLLHRIGVPVLLRLYPEVGHALPPQRDAELRAAARFVLDLHDEK